jgi:hypothetical protein
MRICHAVLVLALLSGCSASPPEPALPPPPQPEFVNLEKFHGPLLKIAHEYRDSYRRMGPNPLIAPPPGTGACAGPFSYSPGRLYASASKDSATHGRKLFWLFAKQVSGDSYTSSTSVGQAIVKESWVPEPEGKGDLLGPEEIACIDGRCYKAGARAGLFILFKMDPQTPDTDDGWVYGTIAPDETTVTSAGRVESCMNCHQKARHDRLFGLPGQK